MKSDNVFNVKNLNNEYDYIFLDAFTTHKCPQLWSIDFIKELTGIVAIILLVVIGIMIFWFRKQLHATEDKMAKVAAMDNSQTIKDKNLMIRSLT